PCVRAANGDLDGLPTVILEAMASGVPVVSTDISNIPDVIRHGETGLLAAPGDATSLVERLEALATMSDQARTRMISAARALVETYAGSDRTVATLGRLWS